MPQSSFCFRPNEVADGLGICFPDHALLDENAMIDTEHNDARIDVTSLCRAAMSTQCDCAECRPCCEVVTRNARSFFHGRDSAWRPAGPGRPLTHQYRRVDIMKGRRTNAAVTRRISASFLRRRHRRDRQRSIPCSRDTASFALANDSESCRSPLLQRQPCHSTTRKFLMAIVPHRIESIKHIKRSPSPVRSLCLMYRN